MLHARIRINDMQRDWSVQTVPVVFRRPVDVVLALHVLVHPLWFLHSAYGLSHTFKPEMMM
jgi:hypothetical protein